MCLLLLNDTTNTNLKNVSFLTLLYLGILANKFVTPNLSLQYYLFYFLRFCKRIFSRSCCKLILLPQKFSESQVCQYNAWRRWNSPESGTAKTGFMDYWIVNVYVIMLIVENHTDLAYYLLPQNANKIQCAK